MYPVLFRLGSLEITSFGVMVALGALLGILLLRREAARTGLDAAKITDAALIGVLGGLAGAKLLYVIEHWAEPLSETLLSRGGMSWFGGMTGGLVAGLLAVRWQRLGLMAALSAAAPSLALGQAVGRVGCLLVGDDYGRPTSLPWGMAFPEGLPPTTARVHPTQIYEALVLLVLTVLLVRLRARGMRDRLVFASYLIGAGLSRFLIELVRVNVPVFLGLTTAQLFSIGVVLLGVWLASTRESAPQAAPARAKTSRKPRR
ncbi:MAG: prolipoprotein diacylglyceryl transferase [Acidobacteria bacterium]|nr:prolipoprotein diacylglyceryl transferase [Acidobacteriota bacterium]